jgi:hypothetical protein
MTTPTRRRAAPLSTTPRPETRRRTSRLRDVCAAAPSVAGPPLAEPLREGDDTGAVGPGAVRPPVSLVLPALAAPPPPPPEAPLTAAATVPTALDADGVAGAAGTGEEGGVGLGAVGRAGGAGTGSCGGGSWRGTSASCARTSPVHKVEAPATAMATTKVEAVPRSIMSGGRPRTGRNRLDLRPEERVPSGSRTCSHPSHGAAAGRDRPPQTGRCQR